MRQRAWRGRLYAGQVLDWLKFASKPTPTMCRMYITPPSSSIFSAHGPTGANQQSMRAT